MGNTKKSEFDKVFSSWDILVIAFGAFFFKHAYVAECLNLTK